MQENYWKNLSSIEKGKIAELLFEIECIKHKIPVCRPVVDCRYDLALVVGNKSRRVQVKWCGRDINGSIEIPLRKARGNRRAIISYRASTYSSDEVDFIAAYIPQISRFVIMPPSEFHNSAFIYLRIRETKTKVTNVKYANKYYFSASSFD